LRFAFTCSEGDQFPWIREQWLHARGAQLIRPDPPGDAAEGDPRSLRRVEVDGRISDEQQAGSGDARKAAEVRYSRRVRLADRKRVAADDGDEVPQQPEALEDGAAHPFGLVREHRKRCAATAEFRQDVRDARVGLRPVEEMPAVVLEEAGESVVEKRLVPWPEGTLHEPACSFSDIGARRFERDRIEREQAEDVVHRCGEIFARIDERAVEIEDDVIVSTLWIGRRVHSSRVACLSVLALLSHC
jgi:hypothetical protein